MWQAPGTPSEFHIGLDETKRGSLKHSGWGIASLLLFSIALLFEYGFLDNALTEHRIRKANEARGINVGDVGSGIVEVMCWVAGGFVNFFGAIFGLVGLSRPLCKKTVSAWGLGSNVALPILNILFLFALG